jgi:hypothetical protein
MVDGRSPIRGLVAVGLAFALVVAACGSAYVTSTPSGSAGIGPTTAGPAGLSPLGGNSLATGLLAGLDKLDSYQFSWTLSASAVPPVSGTIINKGLKSYRISDPTSVQFVVVGGRAWTSIDAGKTWAATDLSNVDLTNLTINTGYATWFDQNALSFKMAGEESKNGIQCVRYDGDSSLVGLYSSVDGGSSQITAEVWIAKDGNYPVSGTFGYSGSEGSKSGAFGFSFDVTHINEPANSVAAPTNVLLEPSDSPSAAVSVAS